VSLFDAFLLGLIQGLTEFLPVSSDGHLALAENFLGLRASGELTGVFLDVAVHVATLAAIVIAFRAPLLDLAGGLLRREGRAWRDLGLFAIASVPTVVVGLAFRHQIEALYTNLFFVGVAFVVMGSILWTTRTRMGGTGERPSPATAVWIGLGQAAAIAPAISRSGCTITAAVWGGMDPVQAANFSFVLGVPAIAGAALLESKEIARGIQHVGLAPVGVAFVTAFVSGLFAIGLLRRFLRARAFHKFAPYLWVLGTATLVIWSVRR
jgi:undecaprenyl-diphosphatase